MRTQLCQWGCRLLAIVLLSGCSAASWQSPLSRNHALVGRVWEVAVGKYVERRALDARLAHADFLLLGEKHDNPDHHRLQAEVLRSVIAAGRRPAVGFEMFTLDEADAVAKHLLRAPNDAAGLGPAVNWEKSGWPDWAMYQPIAEAALAAKLPIIAANLSSAAVRKISREGSAFDPAQRRELGLDRPLPEAILARVATDIRNSHCGYGSEQSVNAMVTVQRARDAHMAHRLAAGATADGAVLIAGSGHARNDYGVPIYLAATAPGKRVVSIAFIEVEESKHEPREYTQPSPGSPAPFDYLWFTPRVDNEDPCEKFKAQLERMRKP